MQEVWPSCHLEVTSWNSSIVQMLRCQVLKLIIAPAPIAPCNSFRFLIPVSNGFDAGWGYFPDISTPWRYPNSGCIAGTAAAVTAFIHGLVHGTEGGSYGHKATKWIQNEIWNNQKHFLQVEPRSCLTHLDNKEWEIDIYVVIIPSLKST